MAQATPVTAISQLAHLLDDSKLLVVCGRRDDAQGWMDALGDERCLAVDLDASAMAQKQGLPRSETGRLEHHHQALAGLQGSGWLADIADTFDPQRRAKLIAPDPLDPQAFGSRHRLGARLPMWQLCESKTVVDVIWDRLGVRRPPSVLADRAEDLALVGQLIDQGDGVVGAVQSLSGAVTSGAEGMWWWQGSTTAAVSVGRSQRVKLMPLLRGYPVRLHGMVFRETVLSFPPVELVTLPRPDTSNFLCCGASGRFPDTGHLRELTEQIGSGLSTLLGYRGAFSVDGIMTTSGFLPTDLNTRLTSAFEAAPTDIRIELHAANVLARQNASLSDPAWLEEVVRRALPEGILTIYGAAARVSPGYAPTVPVRWESCELVASNSADGDGQVETRESLRGWTVFARLETDRLPSGRLLGPYAPAVFRFADQTLGTDFGRLLPPFGMEQPLITTDHERLRTTHIRRPDRPWRTNEDH